MRGYRFSTLLFLIFLAIVVLATIALRYAEPINDGDIWFHLAYGRYFIEHHTLTIDHSIFSWTPAKSHWMYCAWIPQIIFYLLYETCGLYGLFALRYLVIITFLFLVFLIVGKNRAKFLPYILLICLIGLLMAPAGLRIKADLFSFLFMTTLVFLWFRFKINPDKSWPVLYLLPVLFLFWVNSHPGFIFGAIFLSLVFTGEVINRLAGSSEKIHQKILIHLFIACVLSMVSVFITPYGWEYTISLVNELIFSSKAFSKDIRSIAEYQSIFLPQASHFHFIDYLTASSVVLAMLLLAQLKRHRTDWGVLLVTAFFMILYMKYMRLTYYWGIIFVFLTSYLARQVYQNDPGPLIKKPLKIAIHGITFILLLFFAVRAQYETFCTPTIGFNPNYISPESEAGYIRKNFPHMLMGNDYYCGSYLLWSLWPTKKVFIDARYFPYSEWYDEAHKFEGSKDKATIESLLKKYNCDLWCLSYYTPVLQYFITSPDWRLVYYGPSACIFLSNKVDISQQTRSVAESISKVGIYQAYLITMFALRVGDLEVAKNIVKAMKPNPLCPLQASWAINAKLNVGDNLLDQGKYYDAIGVYSDAIMKVQQYPLLSYFWGDDFYTDLASIHQNLGNSLLKVNQIGEAIKQYNQALKIKPDLATAQRNLALAMAQMTKIDESILKLEYILKNNPYPLKILNSLAVYYSMKGQYDRSIDYLMKELNITPENPGVYYNLACIYSRQNRLKESKIFLDKAIKKGFNDWDLLKKDHDLDNLRNTTNYKN